MAIAVAKVATGQIGRCPDAITRANAERKGRSRSPFQKAYSEKTSRDREEGGCGAVGVAMAKSKHKQDQPILARQANVPPPQSATVQISLGYDPKGRMEPRDVVISKDGWSEYTLDDGSVLRTKAAILDVKRAVDQYGPDGNPIYILQFAVINQVQAPDILKKKE